MKKQHRSTLRLGIVIGSAALALGLIATPASADPTISNGSFETPSASASPYYLLGPTIPSWSSAGGILGASGPGTGAGIINNLAGLTLATPYGSQWLSLNTGRTNDSTTANNNPTNLYVWQKIGTVEKGVYTFNYLLQSRSIDSNATVSSGFFDISLWAGGDSPFDNSDQPLVRAGDGYAVNLGVDSAINVPTQGSTNAESSVFVLTNTPYAGQDLWLRLHLQQGPGGLSGYNSLHQMLFDNVTVAFVPEPSSLMLLALGGGLMALRRRRS